MEQVWCTKCGKGNLAKARLCLQCGERLSPLFLTNQPNNSKLCRACETVNTADAQTCKKCGSPLPAAPSARTGRISLQPDSFAEPAPAVAGGTRLSRLAEARRKKEAAEGGRSSDDWLGGLRSDAPLPMDYATGMDEDDEVDPTLNSVLQEARQEDSDSDFGLPTSFGNGSSNGFSIFDDNKNGFSAEPPPNKSFSIFDDAPANNQTDAKFSMFDDAKSSNDLPPFDAFSSMQGTNFSLFGDDSPAVESSPPTYASSMFADDIKPAFDVPVDKPKTESAKPATNVPDWLLELSSSPAVEAKPKAEPAPASELPDWLGGSGGEEAISSTEGLFQGQTPTPSAIPNWLRQGTNNFNSPTFGDFDVEERLKFAFDEQTLLPSRENNVSQQPPPATPFLPPARLSRQHTGLTDLLGLPPIKDEDDAPQEFELPDISMLGSATDFQQPVKPQTNQLVPWLQGLALPTLAAVATPTLVPWLQGLALPALTVETIEPAYQAIDLPDFLTNTNDDSPNVELAQFGQDDTSSNRAFSARDMFKQTDSLSGIFLDEPARPVVKKSFLDARSDTEEAETLPSWMDAAAARPSSSFMNDGMSDLLLPPLDDDDDENQEPQPFNVPHFTGPAAPKPAFEQPKLSTLVGGKPVEFEMADFLNDDKGSSFEAFAIDETHGSNRGSAFNLPDFLNDNNTPNPNEPANFGGFEDKSNNIKVTDNEMPDFFSGFDDISPKATNTQSPDFFSGFDDNAATIAPANFGSDMELPDFFGDDKASNSSGSNIKVTDNEMPDFFSGFDDKASTTVAPANFGSDMELPDFFNDDTASATVAPANFGSDMEMPDFFGGFDDKANQAATVAPANFGSEVELPDFFSDKPATLSNIEVTDNEMPDFFSGFADSSTQATDTQSPNFFGGFDYNASAVAPANFGSEAELPDFFSGFDDNASTVAPANFGSEAELPDFFSGFDDNKSSPTISNSESANFFGGFDDNNGAVPSMPAGSGLTDFFNSYDSDKNNDTAAEVVPANFSPSDSNLPDFLGGVEADDAAKIATPHAGGLTALFSTHASDSDAATLAPTTSWENELPDEEEEYESDAATLASDEQTVLAPRIILSKVKPKVDDESAPEWAKPAQSPVKPIPAAHDEAAIEKPDGEPNVPSWLQALSSGDAPVTPPAKSTLGYTQMGSSETQLDAPLPDWLAQQTTSVPPVPSTPMTSTPPPTPKLKTGVTELLNKVSSTKTTPLSQQGRSQLPAWLNEDAAKAEQGFNLDSQLPDWLNEESSANSGLLLDLEETSGVKPTRFEEFSNDNRLADAVATSSPGFLSDIQGPAWMRAANQPKVPNPPELPPIAIVDSSAGQVPTWLRTLNSAAAVEDEANAAAISLPTLDMPSVPNEDDYELPQVTLPPQLASASVLSALLTASTTTVSIPATQTRRLPLGLRTDQIVRYALYLLLILIALLAIFSASSLIPTSVVPSPTVKNFYSQLDSLSPDAKVLVVYDWEADRGGEMRPMAQSVTQHLMLKRTRLINFSLNPQGPALATQVNDELTTNPSYGNNSFYSYSTNYLNLGWRSGNEAAVRSLFDRMGDLADYRTGFRAGDYPAMQGINSLSDFDMIVVLAGDESSVRTWVEQVGILPGSNLLFGTPASIESIVRPYALGLPTAGVLRTTEKQVRARGLISGLNQTFQYQQLLKDQLNSPTDQRIALETRLTGQSMAALFLVVVIIGSNVVYLIRRRE